MTEKKFIVIKGLPGSGKSTLVEKIIRENYSDFYITELEIHSTDYFWLRPNGTYDFNPTLLGDAHEWNFKEFCLGVEEEVQVVILDNTNTMWWEMEKYVRYAQKHGYEIEIREPDTEWKFNVEECAKRNTHGVPKESIQKMLDRWESTESCLGKINAQTI